MRIKRLWVHGSGLGVGGWWSGEDAEGSALSVHPEVSCQPEPASSSAALLPQAWGLTPHRLKRINFVLTPLEAGLQSDLCLFMEEEEEEGPKGLNM